MDAKLKSIDGGKMKIMQRSPFTDDIIRELRKVPQGAGIGYDELSAAVGMNVRGTNNLQTARNALMSEGILFATKRGEGLIRCDAKAGASIMRNDARAVGRHARRALKKGSTVNIAELTNEDRVSFNASAALLGAVGAMASTSGIRKLEEKTKNSLERLPLGKTLDALKE